MAKGEHCPKCGEDALTAYDSRPHDDPNVLRRRNKKCRACDHRVTTHEIIVSEDGVGQKHAQRVAIDFLGELEALARAHFGDAAGNFRLGTTKRNGGCK